MARKSLLPKKKVTLKGRLAVCRYYFRLKFVALKVALKDLWKAILHIPEDIHQLYLNHFETYIGMCQANEHMYIGRKLWNLIRKDMKPEDMANIRIWFKKYPVVTDGGGFQTEYMMFVNPDISMYKDPNGNQPFTAQLQFNVFGHIGFQSAQPTPAEIIYEYNIDCEFDDKVLLEVEPFTCNGEKAFIIKRRVVDILEYRGMGISNENDDNVIDKIIKS